MTTPEFEYIRAHYKVPAELGRSVIVDGTPGVIAADRGNYIGVVFDGCKPNDVRNCHPTWRVVYGDMKPPPKMTRSQRNYQAFLDADCGFSFREWMGFNRKPSLPRNRHT